MAVVSPNVIEVDQIDDESIEHVTTNGGFVFRKPWTDTFFSREMLRYGVEFPPGTKKFVQEGTHYFILPNKVVLFTVKIPYFPYPAYALRIFQLQPPFVDRLPIYPLPYKELSLAAQVAVGNAGGSWNGTVLSLPIEHMQRSETCNTNRLVCWYLPTGMKIHVVPAPPVSSYWEVSICSVFTEEVSFLEFPEKTDFYSGEEDDDVPEDTTNSWHRG